MKPKSTRKRRAPKSSDKEYSLFYRVHRPGQRTLCKRIVFFAKSESEVSQQAEALRKRVIGQYQEGVDNQGFSLEFDPLVIDFARERLRVPGSYFFEGEGKP